MLENEGQAQILYAETEYDKIEEQEAALLAQDHPRELSGSNREPSLSC